MSNAFGLKASDLDEIIAILKQETGIEEALIFGSRAKGNYKQGSDIDICLKGQTLLPEKVSRISYLLNEESIMPYKFDILNYNTLANDELKEHINRVGLIFYKR